MTPLSQTESAASKPPAGDPPALIAPTAHGEAMAALLRELHADNTVIAAGQLVPRVIAGEIAIDTLEKHSDADTAALIRQVVALPAPEMLNNANEEHLASGQSENLRKMLLAMVRDVRVILVRLADHTVQMREAKSAGSAIAQQAARLAREIYAPLANRLGIWQIKWEMEDLAFRYLEPDNYRQVARWLAERRVERENYITHSLETLHMLFQAEGIGAEISGRPKHIYSIWRKMQRKNVDFNELYDLRAVRVLVNSVKDCYTALGLVHGQWPYVRHEFDDYIALPKDNGYRSLHTVVTGPGGKMLEIQIRTHKMHQQAESGVASHWRYKEGGTHDSSLESRIAWLRTLLQPEPGTDVESDQDFIDRFKEDIFEDRIYVFTPKGEIFDLPAGATPLDFAYYVHTNVGHRCRGARINGRITPLTTALKTGDRVDILTVREGTPSRDWLIPQAGYMATPRARAKLRTWFRQQDHGQNVSQGRSLLERELKRLSVDDLPFEKLVEVFAQNHLMDGSASLEKFLALLGSGDITTAQLAGAIERLTGLTKQPTVKRRAPRKQSRTAGLQVRGVDNLLTQLARCCNPLPPEDVVGFITRGRGISVHRNDCGNVRNADPGRLIDVEWETDNSQFHAVHITLHAHERHGILRDISTALTSEDVNILAMNSQVDRGENLATIQLTLEIRNLAHLSHALHRIGRLNGIISAQRTR